MSDETGADLGCEPAVRITATGLVTCLGHGRAAHVEAMREGRTGLAPCTMEGLPFDCAVGRVEGLETLEMPASVAAFDNRASRLALAALGADGFAGRVAEVRARWGAERFGLVLGTSTAGIDMLERVYRARGDDEPLPADYSMRHHDNIQSVAAFLQALLGLGAPCYSVSTACSSSAKALIDAVQLVKAGVCDAVLTGGVDSLCLTPLNGFESLQLISRRPCRPCDATRDGLSIGEGAALMIVERDARHGIRVAGFGETSDGHNMSTPPEDGRGAAAAMRAALESAGIGPGEIGYVNLHGTATPSNDSAEARAVEAVLGHAVPASSLKGAVGHTLGAAGAVEAVLCLFALEEGLIPPNVGMERVDPAIGLNIVTESGSGQLSYVLSNAFGFGGSNTALVLAR